jgi:PQQ-dependent dehydrogenase (methanol/ethanol family)
MALLALAALIFALAAGARPDERAGGTATIMPAPAFAPLDLVKPAAADWATNGGDYGQTRYSSLAQITAKNVRHLHQAWHVHLNGSGTGQKFRGEATPLVYGGIMYVGTGQGDVFAVDASNGSILWQYAPNLPPTLSAVCCGWSQRGLALGDGKVYVARLDATLVALSQFDGHVIWTTTNGSAEEGATMTMAPLYYNGLVIVGVSGGEFGVRGSLTAYDARDGHRVWRFYTVPSPDQPGGKTWPPNDEWRTGGGPVWDTPSVDPKRNLLYFTTGNAYPWSSRQAGDDLFTSSFVAIDPATGSYRWHYQVVHHDIWDYDCASNTVLFARRIRGKLRYVVAEPCKTGWVYELLRRNGLPATEIDEKPVPQSPFQHTSATQPIPVGDSFARQCADPKDFPKIAPDGFPFHFGCIFSPFNEQRFTAVAPGAAGGSTWSPASYNPQTGLLYVCSRDSQYAYKAIPTASGSFSPGKSYVGVQVSFPSGRNLFTGGFTALNMTTNRIKWRRAYTRAMASVPDSSCEGGSVTTAGNLVFTPLPQAMYHGLVAYNATTGRRVWRFHTDAGVEAPPISYSAGGKQYVAVLAGGRVGHGQPVVKGDDLYAFALG